MGKQEITKSDYMHALIKGVLSAIPLAGGIVSEIFNLLITPPLEKRREKWLSEIYDKFLQLEQKVDNLSIEKLFKDDRFISYFIMSTQIAIRNHEEEKHHALLNLLSNSISEITVDDSINQVFFNLIDTLTIWHLKVLILLNDPRKWFIDNNIELPKILSGSLKNVILKAYPELTKNRDFLKLIGDDLYNKGLITKYSFDDMYREEALFMKQTSDFGEKFLRLISQ